MAIISLREYIREIKSLIEAHNESEAVEHCKFILKKFPKHLDTYRLLGQAYLEAGFYTEAADLLLRVLSVVPEDFVAHLGLSVVNEEQSNLDAAIWHMERAYEVRSTETLHEELQRLFSMRDGFAPPKPYITRGALIRINIRSGLYQQALAEIQRALQEDPQRVDLLILRARIYYMQNNMGRAAESCKMILDKLPYSFDANSIMAEILGSNEKGDQYKLRLHELDPYTTFVNSTTTVDQVSDHAIGIERLDFNEVSPEHSREYSQFESPLSDEGDQLFEQFSQTLLNEDGSADTFEETLQESGAIDLDILEKDSKTIEGKDMNQSNDIFDDDEIPDWMKDAGWETGEPKSEEEEQQQIQAFDELAETLVPSDDVEELAPSDMPDWLKDFAPPEAIDENINETEAENTYTDETLVWLNDILSQPDADAPTLEFEAISEDIENETVALPESLNQPIFGENIDADLEWLEQISSPKNTDQMEPVIDDAGFDEPAENDELEWLTPVETEDKPSNQETEYTFEAAGEPTLVIPQFDDTASNVETHEEETLVSLGINAETEAGEEDFDFDSALAWLEGLAAKQGADEQTLSTTPEERKDIAPEWAASDAAAIIDSGSFDEIESVQEYHPDMETVPDWLEDESGIETEEEEPADAAVETFEELPPWMQNISPPEHVEESPRVEDKQTEALEPSPVQGEETLDISEWLDEEPIDEEIIEFEETSIAEKISDEQPLHSTAVLDFIKSSDDQGSDEIDQWLENLPDFDWENEDKSSFSFAKKDETQPSDSFANDRVTSEMMGTEDIIEEAELFSDESTEPALTASTDFIDDFFADETQDLVENEESDREAAELTETPPYIWEQEFTGAEPILSAEDEIVEDELPDWIADIPDNNFLTTVDAVPEQIPAMEEFEEEVLDESPLIPEPELPEEIAVVIEESVSLEASGTAQPEPLEAELDHLLQIAKAKNLITDGQFQEAHSILEEQIREQIYLDEVIEILQFDINHYHPIEVDSWILLGDAYFKQGDLAKALDSYIKAEDLI